MLPKRLSASKKSAFQELNQTGKTNLWCTGRRQRKKRANEESYECNDLASLPPSLHQIARMAGSLTLSRYRAAGIGSR